jgi:exopolyphosphatase/guanosine-5'-triphosphate,3'-diphosphate pyrophosphatase
MGASPALGAVAAVDCGTNSTRLLVSGPDGSTRVRLMRITRLGQDVDRTGVLSAAAIARTVAVLEEYRSVMDGQGVTRVRLTATSAARDAANRDEFFAAAQRAVGVVPELLGGAEEARLSFAGATAELDLADGPWLVADIGGGSTELAVGPALPLPLGDGPGPSAGLRLAGRLEPVAVRSLDIGCVRVTERFLTSDPPTAAELEAAVSYVESLLDDVSDCEPAFSVPPALPRHPSSAPSSTLSTTPAPRVATLVGLAGTVAALAALDQELGFYDRDRLHHHVLRAATVDKLLAGLAGQTVAERLERPGMEAERADVIVGGTLILSALLRHFRIDRCLTSEADILDGLAMTLLAGG